MPNNGVRAERGERVGGGEAEANGCLAAQSQSSAKAAILSFLEGVGRGGQEEEGGPGDQTCAKSHGTDQTSL
jgi:hypothetical protein